MQTSSYICFIALNQQKHLLYLCFYCVSGRNILFEILRIFATLDQYDYFNFIHVLMAITSIFSAMNVPVFCLS